VRRRGPWRDEHPLFEEVLCAAERGEREQLQVLIRKGKGPAKRRLKARILLKADVSEFGEILTCNESA
jgi:hypothetical protein